jgi:hypothetical protein
MWFIAIIIAICVIQYIQVNWFSLITRTKSLDVGQWGGCVIIGSTTLLISLLLKTTPGYMLKFIPFQEFVDEDRAETNEYVEMALSKDPAKMMGGKGDDDAYAPVEETEDNWETKGV